jgi:thioredoxin-like negative regulator of GroEL
LLVIVIVFASVALVVGASKLFAPKELVPWQSDLRAARDLSAKTKKPVLAYFTAEWCGPCQEMRRSVFSDHAVADAASKFIPVRIDVDRQSQLAQQFQIEAMPTFVLISPSGQIIRSQMGAMDSRQFIRWLGSQQGNSVTIQ